jgi:hypothetical protein
VVRIVEWSWWLLQGGELAWMIGEEKGCEQRWNGWDGRDMGIEPYVLQMCFKNEYYGVRGIGDWD